MLSKSLFERCRAVFCGVILLSALAFAARGEDAWTNLENADLLAEARAAHHLGWTAPEQRAASLSQPTALELLDRLDAGSPAGAVYASAKRLRLVCLLRLGRFSDGASLVTDLPSNVEGFSANSWTYQRALWQAMIHAAQGDWNAVETSLGAIPLEQALTEEAAADLALIRSRLRIRQFEGSTSSYLSLAQVVASASSWEISDPLFDPYYAQEDFAILHEWDAVKQVMGALDGDSSAQKIGARRWFELAAPSAVNPFGTLFPDAPPQDRLTLTQVHATRSATFGPDAAGFVPAHGGYRGLLEVQLAVEDLIYCGAPYDILLLEERMTSPPQGIPEALWNSYRLAWKTLGHAGTLAIGEVKLAADQIEQAMTLLPPAPIKSYTLGLVGLVHLSGGNPHGNELFAEALRIPLPHPLITKQWVKQLSTRTRNIEPTHVLEILAQPAALPSGEAQRLMSRSVFAQRMAEKMPEASRQSVLQEAIADGAQALNLLESAREPLQVDYREILQGPLAASLRGLGEDEAATIAEAGFNGSVRNNHALSAGLPPLAPGLPLPEPILAVNSAYAEAREQIAAGPAGNESVGQLSTPDLVAALASMPESPRSATDFSISKILLNEAARRGWNTLELSSDETARRRLRYAEFALADAESKDAAIAELSAVTSDQNINENTRAQAATMLDGLGEMESFDAYMWAQDWYTFIEKHFTKEKLGHFELLALPLAGALEHSEVQAFLNDSSVPGLVRMNHRYNLAQACMKAGKDDKALGLFNSIIDGQDEQEAPDDILRPLAESWRMQIWWRQSEAAEDKQERRQLQALIVETARQRLSTLAGPDEAEITFAQWGLMAAKALKDREAMDFFEAKAKRRPAAQLF